VERERNVQRELAKQSGKPDNVIDKMIEGRMRKFYEESVLLSQIFVIDGETPVNKAVEKLAKEIGKPVEVVGFVRFQVGEGIEKTSDDFSDEVNKLAGR
jgi:elongation factor Ts